MERQLFLTADGSHTMIIPGTEVSYHSKHGAIRESRHVYIETGLQYFLTRNNETTVRIFEMGFGTGLNAFLTLQEAIKNSNSIFYQAVELHPLTPEEARLLNYSNNDTFLSLHTAGWGKAVAIHPLFTLHKLQASLLQANTEDRFHVIYYDAFAPDVQPELWEKPVFEQLYRMMEPGGILVTYCVKGDVRRAMLASGLTIEKVPGPPGKKEILRALKPERQAGSYQPR